MSGTSISAPSALPVVFATLCLGVLRGVQAFLTASLFLAARPSLLSAAAQPAVVPPALETPRSATTIAVTGRVLYHDGTPAVGVSVFLGFDKSLVWITGGKAWTGSETEPDEDLGVTKTTTDTDGRFRLPGGGGDGAKTIAVSGPSLDVWAVPAPETDAKAFTIKLPQPGTLVVRYDIAGGPAEANLLMQRLVGNTPGCLGVRSVGFPKVANGGRIVFDNLPPGPCELTRYKSGTWGGRLCDRRTVTIASGKTVTSDFVREHGTPVQGQIAGLKEGMFAEMFPHNSKPGALVTVRPVEATGKSWIEDDWKLTIFDVFSCGRDAKFQTERLSPSKYAIIAEVYSAMTPEESISTGERLPTFLGRAEVTVPEDGPPPLVTLQLTPREPLSWETPRGDKTSTKP